MYVRIYRICVAAIATVCGVGLLPRAPGTWGSLVAVAFAWMVAPLGFGGFMMIGAALFALGLFAADRCAAWRGTKDPQVVVIDEVVGMWIALWWLPLARTHEALSRDMPLQYVLLALSFGLFRWFDIKKYAPARRMEALPGGWGIMLDDVVAGLYAGVGVLACIGLWLLQ